MEKVLAKGLNFVFAREFIEREYGLGTWDALMDQLPESDATIWNSAELDLAYPFSAFKEGVLALSNSLGTPEMIETSRMYMYIADRSLSTLYKTFFRLTSPMFVIKNYPRLWQRFFNTGTVKVVQVDRLQAVVTFTLPEIFLDWLAPACLGYSQKAVEMAGGKFFTMRPLDRKMLPSGEWQISFKLSWQ